MSKRAAQSDLPSSAERPSPTFAARLTVWLAAAAAAAAAIALGVKLSGLRGDLRLLSIAARLVPSILLGAASIGGLAWVLLRRGGSWIFVAAAVAATFGATVAREGYVSVELVPNLDCFGWGLLVASVPVAIALVGLRAIGDGALLRTQRACATIGAAGGLAAASTLHLHCSFRDVPHALLLHALLVAVVALAAARSGSLVAVRAR